MYTLPRDHAQYVEQIQIRCDRLINRRIWDGIDHLRLKGWLNNFNSDKEKYFAARLLDSLIYRSEDQIKAAITQLFKSTLPNYTRKDMSPAGAAEEWLSRLRGNSEPQLRLVIPTWTDSAKAKSTDEVKRLLQREFRINAKWFIEPPRIEGAIRDGVRTFVFLDDFVGTGSQFTRLVTKYSLRSCFKNEWCLHASLMRHSKSREAFDQLKGLKSCAVEELDDSCSLFHTTCRAFNDSINTASEALAYYKWFVKDRDLEAHYKDRRHGVDYKLGFGSLALSYATKISAPNNSLPLFWHDAGGSWHPLFLR